MDTTDPRPVGHPFPEAREYPASGRRSGVNSAGAVPVEQPLHNSFDTPPRASFEGRPLHHPADDVEDQGLAFDVGTLVSRRGALGVLGAGSVTAVLAACTGGSTSTTAPASDGGGASDGTTASELTEMPGETAGPYPGDGSNGADVLETSGVERSDIRSSIDTATTAEGVPLEITMTIIDMAGGDVPMEGAAVYLWQCDAAGQYSMYSEGVEEETYLRGVQIADAQGQVTFTSIFPGCYAGRWPHLHFEVFPDAESIVDATNAILTSQIALPEAEADGVYALAGYEGSAENLAQLTLETDGIFSDGYDQQLAALSGDLENGYSFTIDVPIDTTTEPEVGGEDGGAPGGEDGGAPGGEAPGSEGGEPPSGREGGEPPAEGEGGPGEQPPAERPSGGNGESTQD